MSSVSDNEPNWPDTGEHPGSHDIFNIIERVCSIFSLIGCVFIIFTFCLSKRFHKPINRLAFFATFGNLATNVATLMGRSFVDNEEGAGCQVQAFLIQMFMPADAFWVLAMAINVYLIFERQYDAHKLRQMEKYYFLGCYGVTFIIALVYCFIRTEAKGKMYGDATLWCWISPKWDIFRIATFYGPDNGTPSNLRFCRVSIGFTFFIYIRAGRDIYKNHRQIKKFHISSSYGGTVDETLQSRKITEISVTHEFANRNANAIGMVDLERNNHAQERLDNPAPRPPPNAYSVTISADNQKLPQTADGDNLARTTTLTGGLSGSANMASRAKSSRQNNSAMWHYTKCALFFFTALLVTWIPSSCNRVFSVVHHNQTVKVLEYMGAGVLPLQGFWNAVIYAVTSWKACKNFFGEDMKDWFSRDPDSGNRLRRESGHHRHSSSRVIIGQAASAAANPFHRMSGRPSATSETESMEELAACGSSRSSYGAGHESITKDVR
ncbi:hypothetical protein B0T20DRAFT_343808 [Sordaria brevicollis]|uniref:G-protein coupled receptors family 2 profile 2 domain-containing protein n=1 Tax=Sordaria brevicollis TaxID=83679 RepID=A0AAE0PMV8_SORBR|nr:hypothetical protein B0T20DRAFT_343808 [Sordaria brevicollis]